MMVLNQSLKGSGGDKPVLEYLPEDFVVFEGVDVFTSGKDGLFSPGTPIGTTTNDGKVKLFSSLVSYLLSKLISLNKIMRHFKWLAKNIKKIYKLRSFNTFILFVY